MDITEKHLHQVWQVEQEILDVIHDICKRNNLKYSLAYGTLLGAVRHSGFIPWDDDIDIIMPRKDYEELKRIWMDEAPKNYILMDYHTNHDNPNTFTKIVKDNTTFLQDEDERSKSFHKGIFVDIVPGDLVASNWLSKKLQYIVSAIYLLYSRGYTSGNKGIIGVIEKALLKAPRKNYYKYRVKAEKYLRKWNNSNSAEIVFIETISESKMYFPSNIFDNLFEIQFNGKEYKAVVDFDAMLKTIYGDYMQLPPEEERVWHHHPLIIDFEHNYEDLKRK